MKFPFSGEFWDLTLTSYNNIFGREKITNALHYGISTPLNKYIDELELLSILTNDDKSSKRIIRLNFLKECDKFPMLQILFKNLINWLNGGGDKKTFYIPGHFSSSQYYQQNLIITVAGGNIYIIFAKLLANIIWTSQNFESDKIFDNLTKTNKNILDEMENNTSEKINKFVILNEIIQNLQNPDLLKSLNEILLLQTKADGFTDFDYNLLPNKNPHFDEDSLENRQAIGNFIKELDRMIEGRLSKSPKGFALFRLKSFISCHSNNIDYINEDDFKSNCKLAVENGIISQDMYNKLIPQLIQENFKSNPELQTPKYSECLKLINHLLDKKATIKEATLFNIEVIINYFSNYLQSELNGIYTGPNDWNLEAIIYYINYTNYKLNFYIREWEDGKLLTYYPPTDKDTYTKIVKSFLSLNSIVRSSYLLGLSGSMIEYLIRDPDPYFNDYSKSFTQKILNEVLVNIKGKSIKSETINCNNASLREFKITLVESSDNQSFNPYLEKYLVKGLEVARLAANIKTKIKNGIHVVINAVVTDKDYDLNTLNLTSEDIQLPLLEFGNLNFGDAIEGISLEKIKDITGNSLNEPDETTKTGILYNEGGKKSNKKKQTNKKTKQKETKKQKQMKKQKQSKKQKKTKKQRKTKKNK